MIQQAAAGTLRDHVARMAEIVCEALEASAALGQPYEGVVFHAGEVAHYANDDLEVPFRGAAHFRRVAPLPGPGHWAVFRSGDPPAVFRRVSQSYWSEAPETLSPQLEEVLQPSLLGDAEPSPALPGKGSARWAYVGPEPERAREAGLSPAGKPLLDVLDWYRAEKTAYEVACIRLAIERAARGHVAAHAAAAARRSEREIHAAYLAASEQLDADTPYPNIVAWDEHAATLHYASKSLSEPSPGDVFLLDAGASHAGYASDITRTVAHPSAPESFHALLAGMAALQDHLVSQVRPGLEFASLHEEALRGVAELLCEVGVLRVSQGEALERGFAHAFLPHGLGHHLGLQVHDVGGRMRGPDGSERLAPEATPNLRTTRCLEVAHVVTIEPGLYFVPMLLDPLRARAGDAVDWQRVDSLIPCGGIRIEDDVRVTEEGYENLSRAALPVVTRF